MCIGLVWFGDVDCGGLLCGYASRDEADLAPNCFFSILEAAVGGRRVTNVMTESVDLGSVLGWLPSFTTPPVTQQVAAHDLWVFPFSLSCLMLRDQRMGHESESLWLMVRRCQTLGGDE